MYVSKFIMYELVAVMNVPVWPSVNPRKAKTDKGGTWRVAFPELEVKVKRLFAGDIAKTPTPFPTVVFKVAKNEV
jgi:hypothetical protein